MQLRLICIHLHLGISLFWNSSWIKITASRLYCELGLHAEKKSMEIWNIIKNGHSEDKSFRTALSKPGDVNILWGNSYYDNVILKLTEEEIQCHNKMLQLFFMSYRWLVWSKSWSSWTSRHYCRNSSKVLQQGFVIMKGKFPSESTTLNSIYRSFI